MPALLWTAFTLGLIADSAAGQSDPPSGLAAHALTAPELVLQSGHLDPIYRARFSPDGELLVTCTGDLHDGRHDRTAILWEVRTGRKLREFPHRLGVNDVAFSPDGKRLATASMDQTAVIWDVASGRSLHTLRRGNPAHWGQYAWNATFSPDGRHLLVASDDNALMESDPRDRSLAMWDVATGRQVRLFDRHVDAVTSIQFSADGSRLLTASNDGTAVLWQTSSGAVLARFAHGAGNYASGAWLVDGERQALVEWEVGATKERRLTFWDLQTQRGLRTLRGAWVGGSRDGRWLLLSGSDGTLELWDATAGRPVFKPAGRLRPAQGLSAVSPDGRSLVVASPQNELQLLSTADGQLQKVLGPAPAGDVAAGFSPDGRYILLGSGSNKWNRVETGQIWDASSGRLVSTLAFTRPLHPVTSVAFAPDGAALGTTHADQTALVWNGAPSRPAAPLNAGDSQPTAIAFVSSPTESGGTETRVGTRDVERTLRLWNVDTGEQLAEVRPFDMQGLFDVPFGRDAVPAPPIGAPGTPLGELGRMLYMPAGHHGAGVARDGQFGVTFGGNLLAFWNLLEGQKLGSIESLTGLWFTTADYSPDGRYLATGDNDWPVMIWDVAQRQPVWLLNAASQPLRVSSREQARRAYKTDQVKYRTTTRQVKFSPDGRRLLAVKGSLAIIYDTASGAETLVLRGHKTALNAAAWSPDGRRILTASDDATARLWDAATGAELLRLFQFNQGRDWLAAAPNGLFDGTAEARNLVAFRIGEGLSVVPVDRFFQDFYSPGLLTTVLGGATSAGTTTALAATTTAPPVVEVSAPPRVAILRPSDGDADSAEVTIDVELVDQGGGISGPSLRHNGARVLAGGEKRRQGDRLLQTFTVQLVEGENRFRVEAASADGSWESEPARLTLHFRSRLPKPDLYVLSVGVNRYADPAFNLAFAARDAEAMAGLFRSRGPSLYRQVKVTELLDEQATRSAIRTALSEFARQAQPQDALLVFLSGHGFTIGQRYYFIPHDFESGGDRFEDDIRRSGYPMDELGDALGAVPALKRMLILDTCNSGAALERTNTRSRNPFGFRGAIERLARSQGVFAIAASAASEETVEIEPLRHGVLTYSLLAALRAVEHGPLADKSIRPDHPEQVVSVLDWFSFASGEAPRLTRQFAGQAQDVKVSGEGSSFPVLPLETR